MYFPVILITLLMSSLTLGSLWSEARSFRSLKFHNDSSSTTILSYEQSANGQCVREHVREAHKLNIACVPRPTLVRLPHPKDLQITAMDPSYVEIVQCGGGNPRRPHMTCLATETKDITIKVFLSGRRIECGEVVIKEHVKCSLGCKIKPSDCSEFQNYSADRCRCECPNQSEALPCTQGHRAKKSFWDMSLCKCMVLSEI